MKCPLRDRIKYSEEGLGSFEKNDCIKEECAWWRGDIQMCSIKDLSLELGYTQMRLADILEKMPHELQFRK